MALSLLRWARAPYRPLVRSRKFGPGEDHVTYTFATRLGVIALALGCYAAPSVFAQEARPDNTGVNKRDRQSSEVTADQQKNNRSDIELTRQIRKALVADKSLSTYARNIKVIAQDGRVTLKGPVATAEEKVIVEEKAAEVAGQQNVVSEVSVSTTASSSTKTKRNAQGKAGQ
jgi:hyperosmotically inducible protein